MTYRTFFLVTNSITKSISAKHHSSQVSYNLNHLTASSKSALQAYGELCRQNATKLGRFFALFAISATHTVTTWSFNSIGIRELETQSAYERALTRLAAMHRLSKSDNKFLKLKEVFDNAHGQGISDDTKTSLADFLNRDGLRTIYL